MRMRFPGIVAVLMASTILRAHGDDLSKAVPNNVYLATYHKHNPERDYQNAYYEEVWNTVESTGIIDRLMEMMQSRMSEQETAQFEAVKGQIMQALSPIEWETVSSCTESVYAQKFSQGLPMAEHLLLMRLPENGAADCSKALTNLFGLIEQYSGGRVPIVTETRGGVELTTLGLDPQIPFRPVFGTSDDVFVFATSMELAGQSISMLKGSGGQSKFDDPRVKTALKQLPQWEDGLTFMDGRALFEQLGGIPTFIQGVSGGDPNAARVADLIGTVLSQMDVLDYEVTVEYTEGFQNRSAAYGRIKEGSEDKVFTKMFSGTKPFSNWSSWVPADATGYSLSTGASLHPLYAFAMDLIQEKFPEAQAGLAQFDQIQQQIGINLDKDILQAFPGESVSVSMGAQSVSFIRCNNPERIKELVHRLFDTLQQIPQLQAQQLQLKPVDNLEGFEQISFGMLAMMGVRPVIGFQDGWMILGSHPEAVQKVLDTRAGNGKTVIDAESFKQFDLDVSGPVLSIGYSDLAAGTREAAQAMGQFGSMLPMFLAMAGQNAPNPDDLKPIQEFLGLLPALGEIIGKFDFMEAQLTVTQPGDDPLSYKRETVVTIRPPAS